MATPTNPSEGHSKEVYWNTDQTVQISDLTPGTGATDLGKAEDAAHASGDVGVQMLAVRTDTPTNRSGTDGDYEPLQVSNGYLWVRPDGSAANDAVDAGNPLKIGGIANSSAPSAVAVGDRVNAWHNLNGAYVTVFHATGAPGDADTVLLPITSGGTSRATCAGTMLFNGGTTWDRHRNNHEVTVLASAARTIATNSSDLTNYNARGVILTIDITAVAGAPSLTFTIKYKCTLSGKYVTLLASAALSTVATTQLTVYPGVTAAANAAVAMCLPRVWRLEVAVGSADSVTYSVSGNYVN